MYNNINKDWYVNMVTNGLKYLSIYEELKQRIVDNKYNIGELFPPEPELQKEFSASRITVRRSVQMLVDEGFLKRMPGVGTVVLSNKGSLQLNTLTSFAKDNQHKKITSKIVTYRVSQVPEPSVAFKMDLSLNDLISYQERIRYIDDKPIGFQRIYVPFSIGLNEKDLSDPKISIYKVFEEKGHKVNSADENIEAIISDSELSQYLGLKEGSPVLYVQRLTRDKSQKVIEYAEIYYRGDHYHYTLKLKAPNEQ